MLTQYMVGNKSEGLLQACISSYFHNGVTYSMKQAAMVDHNKENFFSETLFTKTLSDLNIK